jgi:hypothetical protein
MSWVYSDIPLELFIKYLYDTKTVFNLRDANAKQLIRISSAPTKDRSLEYSLGPHRDTFNVVIDKYQDKYILRNLNSHYVAFIGAYGIYYLGNLDNTVKDPINFFVNFSSIKDKLVSINYLKKNINILRDEPEFKILGITDLAAQYNFIFLSSETKDVNVLTQMRNWFLNYNMIDELLVDKFKTTYSDQVKNICRTNIKFKDCEKFCRYNSTEDFCVQGFVNQCFTQTDNIDNAPICADFCNSNKKICNDKFAAPNSKYCSNINSLLNKGSPCWKFYDKNFNDCSTYRNPEDVLVCQEGIKKYQYICNTIENKNDPRCECISNEQVIKGRNNFFSQIKITAKINLEKQINLILQLGKVTPRGEVERNLTDEEKNRITNTKKQYLLAIDNYYNNYETTHANSRTNCFIENCSNKFKRTLVDCNINDLIVASCFNSINVWSLLGGEIIDQRNNQSCNISIDRRQSCNPICKNNEECINSKCVSKEACLPKCEENETCNAGKCEKKCGFFTYPEENICKLSFGKIFLLIFIIIFILVIMLIVIVLIYNRNKFINK